MKQRNEPLRGRITSESDSSHGKIGESNLFSAFVSGGRVAKVDDDSRLKRPRDAEHYCPQSVNDSCSRRWKLKASIDT